MVRNSFAFKYFPSESIATGVSRIIREAIILGRLKPGEKIIENELAKQMGISRSPIRDAFRVLEKEGLVTLYPRRGVRVTEISLKDLKEIYALRANLESLAFNMALSNIKPAQVGRIESLLKTMSVKTKKKDIEGVGKLNEQFHDFILKMSDNDRLNQLVHSLRNQIRRYRMASLSLPGRLEEALVEHQKIVDAFKLRNSALTEKLVKEHILQGGKKLIESMEKGKEHGKNK
jgi:DNA-binding GntR family transcriptional regulator